MAKFKGAQLTSKEIKGVHFVQSQRPGKLRVWYVYAWRGGPQVLRCEGLARPALDQTILDEIERLLSERQLIEDPDDPTGKQLSWLIALWVASPEWSSMTRNTRKTWGSALNVIKRKWGKDPVDGFYNERSKLKIIKWRNSRQATPRAADTGVSVLRALLKFGGPYVGSSINIAADIPRLYDDGNRPEIIWTDEEIADFVAVAKQQGRPAVGDAIRLAALTGLRRADLVSLTPAHLREHTIVKRTQKRTKRRRPAAAIPRLPELNALLEELSTRQRHPECNTILVNDKGISWKPDELTRAVQQVRDHLGLVYLDYDDLDETGEPRARPKHFHDLRGTFITRLFYDLALTDVEIADIMGWASDRVANIRKFYVDQGAYVSALVVRRNERGQTGQQHAPNDRR
jgi:integrase